jgi:hypothetical protein
LKRKKKKVRKRTEKWHKKSQRINLKIKNQSLVGHQWLTPEILATQEAEIRRITVQSQPQ